MDRVTVFRILLAAAFLTAAAVWQIAGNRSRELVRLPLWVRFLDAVWFLTAMWGMAIMILAIWDHAGPVFVRDWLQAALPPIVAWPPVRRLAGLNGLLRGADG